jgi:hypothetical protein
MLGRKTYEPEELAHAKKAMDSQLKAYKKLAKAVGASGDPDAQSALKAFEPLFTGNLALALDRRFVHRLRVVTGKDGTPLNELELISESLMNNDGVMRGNNVIKYIPEDSVLKLEVGDHIVPTAADFERLSKAVQGEVQAKFR